MNKTPSQIALNWIRARTEAQIKDNSACLDFELTTDQLRRSDEKSKIQLGFPHDFISEAATNS